MKQKSNQTKLPEKLHIFQRPSKNALFRENDFLFHPRKCVQNSYMVLKPLKNSFLAIVDIKNAQNYCLTPSHHEVITPQTLGA